MATDNRPRKINLDDVDETEGLGGVGEVDGFDQDVNFEDIKGTQVVPRGEYLLINEGYELKMSKSSNQPMITLRIRIQSGEHEGVPHFQDYSWSEKAKARSKKAFVGMGLDPNFSGTLRSMAEALVNLEYYGIMDIEQSDGINERTQQPYDPRNRIVATSATPQTTG